MDPKRVRDNQKQGQELRLLEQLFAARTPPTPGGRVMSLREHMPDTFNELAQQYGGLIDRALEKRVYKVQQDISKGLSLLARELGLVKAGPRDVIDIHAVTLRAKTKGALPQKADVYAEEGRLMLLELMGHLLSHYRDSCLDAPKANQSDGDKARKATGKPRENHDEQVRAEAVRDGADDKVQAGHREPPPNL